jgi:transcriptional regulator with XRE-family HTH domain
MNYVERWPKMSKLKELRTAKKMSQGELSEKSGISIRVLQNYEQGVRDLNGIGIKRAKPLADALGVRIEDLIED